jgi:hypothetical protein
MPGFGSPADSAAPNDFDYNMWLGPAPERPYNKMRGLYHFRWYWDDLRRCGALLTSEGPWPSLLTETA